jgi:hypothetical protein
LVEEDEGDGEGKEEEGDEMEREEEVERKKELSLESGWEKSHNGHLRAFEGLWVDFETGRWGFDLVGKTVVVIAADPIPMLAPVPVLTFDFGLLLGETSRAEGIGASLSESDVNCFPQCGHSMP